MDSSTFWFSFMKGSMLLSFGGGVTGTGCRSQSGGSDCLYFSASTESVRAARSKKNRARKSRSQNKQQDSRRAREQDFFILKRNHQNIHQNRNAKNKIFHGFILWQCDFFCKRSRKWQSPWRRAFTGTQGAKKNARVLCAQTHAFFSNKAWLARLCLNKTFRFEAKMASVILSDLIYINVKHILIKI